MLFSLSVYLPLPRVVCVCVVCARITEHSKQWLFQERMRTAVWPRISTFCHSNKKWWPFCRTALKNTSKSNERERNRKSFIKILFDHLFVEWVHKKLQLIRIIFQESESQFWNDKSYGLKQALIRSIKRLIDLNLISGRKKIVNSSFFLLSPRRFNSVWAFKSRNGTVVDHLILKHI